MNQARREILLPLSLVRSPLHTHLFFPLLSPSLHRPPFLFNFLSPLSPHRSHLSCHVRRTRGARRKREKGCDQYRGLLAKEKGEQWWQRSCVQLRGAVGEWSARAVSKGRSWLPKELCPMEGRGRRMASSVVKRAPVLITRRSCAD